MELRGLNIEEDSMNYTSSTQKVEDISRRIKELLEDMKMCLIYLTAVF